jgi:hypothetical protein
LEAVLSRLRSAVPSINEEVVFAYQNPEDEAHRSEDLAADQNDRDA